jgi:magnesium-protoporphyrin IX monomethyl ester (oxidative) cyclase
MSYFRNVCLLKAPQAFDIPHPQDISDLTEICYLAGMIKNDVDNVTIPVDFHRSDDYRNFINFLKATPVDLVAISSMTGAFNNAIKLAEIAKKFDKYVVMGGYHPTALYEDVLKSPNVDAVIVGEGEETLKDFVLNGPSGKITGMAYRKNGDIIFNGYRPAIMDLDSIPHPLRSARPVRFGESGDDYSIDTIYTSRGCTRTRTFYANDTANKKWRGRSPENVIEELSILHDPKRKKLLKIWDANFLTDVKRVEKLCDLMIEKGLTNFKIWTEIAAEDIVRAEEIMDKLFKIGLRNVSLGIENPNEETTKLMKKESKGDSVSKAVAILNDHNIKGQGYFIIGHYNQTAEDAGKYPEYAESLGLRHSTFMVMTPYPGTAIFDEYKEENRIKSFDWDLYNNFCAVAETRGMDIETLNRMHSYCLGKFYVKYAFMHQKKPFAMLIPILQQMFTLFAALNLKKRHSIEEIKELLFEFFTANTGREISRPYPMKPPILLRWVNKLTIRIVHSKGKNIDFNITQEKDSRHLMVEATKDKGHVNGLVLTIDEIMKLCRRVSPEKAVLLSCKMESVKNNPKNRVSRIINLFKDRDLASYFFFIGWFILWKTLSGTIAFLIHSAKKRKFSQKKESDE